MGACPNRVIVSCLLPISRFGGCPMVRTRELLLCIDFFPKILTLAKFFFLVRSIRNPLNTAGKVLGWVVRCKRLVINAAGTSQINGFRIERTKKKNFANVRIFGKKSIQRSNSLVRTIGHPPKRDIGSKQDTMTRFGHAPIVDVSFRQESVKTANFCLTRFFAPESVAGSRVWPALAVPVALFH